MSRRGMRRSRGRWGQVTAAAVAVGSLVGSLSGTSVASAGTVTNPPVAGASVPGERDVVRRTGDLRLTTTPVLGRHRLIVVPVAWPGSATPPSVENIDRGVQGAADYWTTVTSGKLTFEVDRRPTVTIPDQGAVCDSSAVWDAVSKQLGLKGTDPFRHLVVVPPRLSDCGFAGQASLGYGDDMSVYINGDANWTTYAHELGHNFGLGHSGSSVCTEGGRQVPWSRSCTFSEYGDVWDIMGASTIQASTSSENLYQMGVLTRREVPLVGGTRTHKLSPVGARTGTRGLSFRSGSTLYTVEYRTPVGQDAWIATERIPAEETGWWFLNRAAGQGVVVRAYDTSREDGDVAVLDMHPETASDGDRALSAGESWELPGQGVAVRVDSTTPDGATVTVTAPAVWPELAGRVGVQLTPGPVKGGAVPLRLSWSFAEGTTESLAGVRVTRGSTTAATTGPTGTSAVVYAPPGEAAWRVTPVNTDGKGRATEAWSWVVLDESSYRGTGDRRWKYVPAKGALGGGEEITTVKGASYTVKVPYSRAIGLVATTGPDRGSMAVYEGARRVGTISLYSPRTQKARVVWVRHYDGDGTHSVRIVNLGDRKRPKVGIDAIVNL